MCEETLRKTFWEKEKVLENNIFSFSTISFTFSIRISIDLAIQP